MNEKKIHPKTLDPAKEIRLPWNPEYDSWHDYWFTTSETYGVGLDHMPLLEYFLSIDNLWAIVPYSVAYSLKDHVCIREIEDGPPDRIIYYLRRQNKQTEEMKVFQGLMEEKLKELGGRVRIY